MQWGRVRIGGQLALLGVFLAASTVRNILSRPEPPNAKGEPLRTPEPPRTETGGIRASYPNHVWSIDTTMVLRWGLWPTHIFRLRGDGEDDFQHACARARDLGAEIGPTRVAPEAAKRRIIAWGPGPTPA